MTMKMRLLCAVLIGAVALAGCGNDSKKREIKTIKEQVQRAYGTKDFAKVLSLSQKGFTLAHEIVGDKSPDTLFFVQAISEGQLSQRNVRGAIAALKQELDLRAAAGQKEAKLQPRRTLLIKLAEENGDTLTAGAQAVLVAKGIEMADGKDPQRVYYTETEYPRDQYAQRVEGDVEISYGLDATGAVTDAHISKSMPPIVFDQAALESFRKWRFTPMLDRTGRPVSSSGFKFTVAFRMPPR